jgi:predicted dehydrogenase
LSLDPEESVRLGRLAKEAERVLQIGFWRRFSPPWVKAREAIVADRIGRPLLVRLSQWDADPPPAAFCDPAVSGGLAVDCGVHEFDLAEWLTGLEIERVRAWALPPVDGGLSDVGDHDNLLAVLELTGGALATVDLSRNARYGDDVRTEILGSRGAVFIEILPTGRAQIGTADGMDLMAGSEAGDATAAGVVNQTKAFAASVRGAAVDVPGAAASARATAVALAVQRATATGQAVEVPSDREAAPWR